MQVYPKKPLLEQTKTLYRTNAFVRFITHVALLALTVLCEVLTTQLVPHSWHVLILALTTETQLWTQLGPISLLLLLVLLAQFLFWFALWSVILWMYIRIFRFYRSKPRQHTQPLNSINQGQQMMGAQKLVNVKEVAKRSWHSLITASQAASVGIQTKEKSAFSFSSEYASAQNAQRQLIMQVGISSYSSMAAEQATTEDNLIMVQGKRREHSDRRPFGLFLVADSCNSLTQGQAASQMAMQAALTALLTRLMSNSTLGHPLLVEMMTDSIRQANRTIYQQNLRGGTALNVGLVVSLVIGTDAYITSIGDCYAYQYRIRQGFIQLTEYDTTKVRAVAGNMENMRPQDTPRNSERAAPFNFLGERARVSAKPFILELQEGDCLLFCSRNLWKSVNSSKIEQLLSDSTVSPSFICNALIQTASELEADKRNTSIILVRMIA